MASLSAVHALVLVTLVITSLHFLLALDLYRHVHNLTEFYQSQTVNMGSAPWSGREFLAAAYRRKGRAVS